LDNGEAAVYICSESSVEEVKAAMQNFSIDVARYQGKGALRILDYTEHFIVDGLFTIGNTESLCKGYYEGAIKSGFKGLRVSCETACFFKHNLEKELVDYDNFIHRSSGIPMVAIYGYRADQLLRSNSSVNVYPELVKAHGNVLFSWIDKELGRIAIS
jgi:hypothetical protein